MEQRLKTNRAILSAVLALVWLGLCVLHTLTGAYYGLISDTQTDKDYFTLACVALLMANMFRGFAVEDIGSHGQSRK